MDKRVLLGFLARAIVVAWAAYQLSTVAIAQIYEKQWDYEKRGNYYEANIGAHGFLNVRAEPSRNAEVLTTLAPRMTVYGTGQTKRVDGVYWYEVVQGELKGWTNSKYLLAVDHNLSRKDLFAAGVALDAPAHTNRCPEDIGPRVSISDAMLAHFTARGFTIGSLCFGMLRSIDHEPETGVEVPKVFINADENTTYEIAINLPDCLKNATPYFDCKINYDHQYGGALPIDEQRAIEEFGKYVDEGVRALIAKGELGPGNYGLLDPPLATIMTLERRSKLKSSNNHLLDLLPRIVVSKNLPRGYAYQPVRLQLRGPGDGRLVGTGTRSPNWFGSSSELSRVTCTSLGTCTAVPVYFGTTRKREDSVRRIGFGTRRGSVLTLGRAVVTVPKSNRKPGELNRPAWRDLLSLRNPFKEDPAIHFTIPNAGITVYASEADFINSVERSWKEEANSEKHALVYIHGFYNSFEDALYRTAQLAYDLNAGPTPFGSAFLFSWTSGADPTQYVYDLENARGKLSVDSLQRFLEIVVSKTGAKHVHIVAHSMGNLPALSALAAISKLRRDQKIFDQVIMAAPDIDAEEFERIASEVSRTAIGLTLYASSRDRALSLSKALQHDYPRAGDVPPDGPIVLNGIDTIDVSDVGTEYFSSGHSVYADQVELIKDISALVRSGTRPPSARDNRFKLELKGGLNYWVFRR